MSEQEVPFRVAVAQALSDPEPKPYLEVVCGECAQKMTHQERGVFVCVENRVVVKVIVHEGGKDG